MTRGPSARVLVLLLAAGCPLAHADPAGKLIFEQKCAVCHAAGPGHPGTQRLAQTRGVVQAVLEQRTDLTPAYVRLVVRQGWVEMPPWRPTEIDDASLTELTKYLARGRN